MQRPVVMSLLDPSFDGVPPVSGTTLLKAVTEKISTGKPVTMVFLGDSITAQKPVDFRDGKGSFVVRFTAYVKAKRGYHYMVFLGNCINHPIDLGHDLFFRGTKAAFESVP